MTDEIVVPFPPEVEDDDMETVLDEVEEILGTDTDDDDDEDVFEEEEVFEDDDDDTEVEEEEVVIEDDDEDSLDDDTGESEPTGTSV